MKKLTGIVAALFVAGLIVTTTGCGGGTSTKATTVKETKGGTAGETKATGETKMEEKKP